MPVIGFLSSLSSDYASYLRDAFRQGVRETGFAEGPSVKYEYRYANGDYSLLATMTDELVRRRVVVIAAGARQPHLPQRPPPRPFRLSS